MTLFDTAEGEHVVSVERLSEDAGEEGEGDAAGLSLGALGFGLGRQVERPSRLGPAPSTPRIKAGAGPHAMARLRPTFG